jgi:hypothetical protein
MTREVQDNREPTTCARRVGYSVTVCRRSRAAGSYDPAARLLGAGEATACASDRNDDSMVRPVSEALDSGHETRPSSPAPVSLTPSHLPIRPAPSIGPHTCTFISPWSLTLSPTLHCTQSLSTCRHACPLYPSHVESTTNGSDEPRATSSEGRRRPIAFDLDRLVALLTAFLALGRDSRRRGRVRVCL